ncbi:MAG TPA: NAD(P)/FAD-dependent oxidoreductase [bacterium]|nr:NAD(P)/FAD-dependent oxidoreductase [bacterium]
MSADGDLFDVTIIGGGPAGLFAAYYAGFRTLRTKIVESLDALGGQVTALYPEKPIYDVAGFPRIVGRELVDNLVEQAGQYSPAICTGETVEKLERAADGTLRLTTARATHATKVLIITAGIGAFHPKTFKKPEIDSFDGRGLYYFVKRFQDFAGKRVLIIGGGDSAVDWANGLNGVARSVTLIHRRDGFRAHEDSVQKMLHSAVDVKVFYELRRLEGQDRLERAVIYNNKTNADETIPVDAAIASLGFLSTLGPIQDWGLELEHDSIRVNTRMETNLAGVYGAGDIVVYPGKVKLIATGFGEAATAVNNAAQYINPKASVFPGHSSSQDVHKQKTPAPVSAPA